MGATRSDLDPYIVRARYGGGHSSASSGCAAPRSYRSGANPAFTGVPCCGSEDTQACWLVSTINGQNGTLLGSRFSLLFLFLEK